MYLKSGARSPILRNSCAEYLGCLLSSAASCAASRLVLIRTYEKTVIGRTVRPIAMNTNAMVSVSNISLTGETKLTMILTPKNEAGRVPCSIEIACQCASEVSESDLNGHPNTTLVLTSEVVTQPAEPQHEWIVEKINKNSHHATAPGTAEYAPMTQKYVPKYLTPIGAFDMLIEKPMRHIMSPDRTKGDRILSLSEK